MNRFNNNNISLSSIWHIISFIFVAGFLFFYIYGIKTMSSTTTSEQAKRLEISIRRSTAQCYAVEGTYPPDLNYLKTHYGLIYDTDLFYVDYTAIGSNIMPDITILPKY